MKPREYQYKPAARRRPLPSLLSVLAAACLFFGAASAQSSPFEVLTLRSSLTWFSTGFVEPAGTYAVLGTAQPNPPSSVVRVSLGSSATEDPSFGPGAPGWSLMATADQDSLFLHGEEGLLTYSVADALGYGYFACTSTNPARIIQLFHSNLTRVATLELKQGEVDISTGFLRYSDKGTGEYVPTDVSLGPPGPDVAVKLFLGLAVSPATVVIVDITGGTMTRERAIPFSSTLNRISLAVLSGNWALFATSTAPSQVFSVDLLTMTAKGTVKLATGENNVRSAVASPVLTTPNATTQNFLLGCSTQEGKTIHVRLDIKTGQLRRTGELTVVGVGYYRAAVATPDGSDGWFSTGQGGGNKVVQYNVDNIIRLNDVEVDFSGSHQGWGLNTMLLMKSPPPSPPSASPVLTAIIATFGEPAGIFKVDLTRMKVLETLATSAGDKNPVACVSDTSAFVPNWLFYETASFSSPTPHSRRRALLDTTQGQQEHEMNDDEEQFESLLEAEVLSEGRLLQSSSNGSVVPYSPPSIPAKSFASVFMATNTVPSSTLIHYSAYTRQRVDSLQMPEVPDGTPRAMVFNPLTREILVAYYSEAGQVFRIAAGPPLKAVQSVRYDTRNVTGAPDNYAYQYQSSLLNSNGTYLYLGTDLEQSTIVKLNARNLAYEGAMVLRPLYPDDPQDVASITAFVMMPYTQDEVALAVTYTEPILIFKFSTGNAMPSQGTLNPHGKNSSAGMEVLERLSLDTDDCNAVTLVADVRDQYERRVYLGTEWSPASIIIVATYPVLRKIRSIPLLQDRFGAIYIFSSFISPRAVYYGCDGSPGTLLRLDLNTTEISVFKLSSDERVVCGLNLRNQTRDFLTFGGDAGWAVYPVPPYSPSSSSSSSPLSAGGKRFLRSSGQEEGEEEELHSGRSLQLSSALGALGPSVDDLGSDPAVWVTAASPGRVFFFPSLATSFLPLPEPPKPQGYTFYQIAGGILFLIGLAAFLVLLGFLFAAYRLQRALKKQTEESLKRVVKAEKALAHLAQSKADADSNSAANAAAGENGEGAEGQGKGGAGGGGASDAPVLSNQLFDLLAASLEVPAAPGAARDKVKSLGRAGKSTRRANQDGATDGGGGSGDIFKLSINSKSKKAFRPSRSSGGAPLGSSNADGNGDTAPGINSRLGASPGTGRKPGSKWNTLAASVKNHELHGSDDQRSAGEEPSSSGWSKLLRLNRRSGAVGSGGPSRSSMGGSLQQQQQQQAQAQGAGRIAALTQAVAAEVMLDEETNGLGESGRSLGALPPEMLQSLVAATVEAAASVLANPEAARRELAAAGISMDDEDDEDDEEDGENDDLAATAISIEEGGDDEEVVPEKAEVLLSPSMFMSTDGTTFGADARSSLASVGIDENGLPTMRPSMIGGVAGLNSPNGMGDLSASPAALNGGGRVSSVMSPSMMAMRAKIEKAPAAGAKADKIQTVASVGGGLRHVATEARISTVGAQKKMLELTSSQLRLQLEEEEEAAAAAAAAAAEAERSSPGDRVRGAKSAAGSKKRTGSSKGGPLKRPAGSFAVKGQKQQLLDLIVSVAVKRAAVAVADVEDEATRNLVLETLLGSGGGGDGGSGGSSGSGATGLGSGPDGGIGTIDEEHSHEDHDDDDDYHAVESITDGHALDFHTSSPSGKDRLGSSVSAVSNFSSVSGGSAVTRMPSRKRGTSHSTATALSAGGGSAAGGSGNSNNNNAGSAAHAKNLLKSAGLRKLVEQALSKTGDVAAKEALCALTAQDATAAAAVLAARKLVAAEVNGSGKVSRSGSRQKRTSSKRGVRKSSGRASVANNQVLRDLTPSFKNKQKSGDFNSAAGVGVRRKSRKSTDSAATSATAGSKSRKSRGSNTSSIFGGIKAIIPRGSQLVHSGAGFTHNPLSGVDGGAADGDSSGKVRARLGSGDAVVFTSNPAARTSLASSAGLSSPGGGGDGSSGAHSSSDTRLPLESISERSNSVENENAEGEGSAKEVELTSPSSAPNPLRTATSGSATSDSGRSQGEDEDDRWDDDDDDDNDEDDGDEDEDDEDALIVNTSRHKKKSLKRLRREREEAALGRIIARVTWAAALSATLDSMLLRLRPFLPCCCCLGCCKRRLRGQSRPAYVKTGIEALPADILIKIRKEADKEATTTSSKKGRSQSSASAVSDANAAAGAADDDENGARKKVPSLRDAALGTRKGIGGTLGLASISKGDLDGRPGGAAYSSTSNAPAPIIAMVASDERSALAEAVLAFCSNGNTSKNTLPAGLSSKKRVQMMLGDAAARNRAATSPAPDLQMLSPAAGGLAKNTMRGSPQSNNNSGNNTGGSSSSGKTGSELGPSRASEPSTGSAYSAAGRLEGAGASSSRPPPPAMLFDEEAEDSEAPKEAPGLATLRAFGKSNRFLDAAASRLSLQPGDKPMTRLSMRMSIGGPGAAEGLAAAAAAGGGGGGGANARLLAVIEAAKEAAAENPEGLGGIGALEGSGSDGPSIVTALANAAGPMLGRASLRFASVAAGARKSIIGAAASRGSIFSANPMSSPAAAAAAATAARSSLLPPPVVIAAVAPAPAPASPAFPSAVVVGPAPDRPEPLGASASAASSASSSSTASAGRPSLSNGNVGAARSISFSTSLEYRSLDPIATATAAAASAASASDHQAAAASGAAGVGGMGSGAGDRLPRLSGASTPSDVVTGSSMRRLVVAPSTATSSSAARARGSMHSGGSTGGNKMRGAAEDAIAEGNENEEDEGNDESKPAALPLEQPPKLPPRELPVPPPLPEPMAPPPAPALTTTSTAAAALGVGPRLSLLPAAAPPPSLPVALPPPALAAPSLPAKAAAP